jgi:hypothetical protein
MRASEQKRKQRKAAVDAVRARSTGESRQEIRRMLIGEFTARSLTMPSERGMDWLVDSVESSGSQSGPVRNLARAAGMLGGLAGDLQQIARLFKGTARLQGPNGEDPYHIPRGRLAPEIEVVLDAGAEQVLGMMSPGLDRGAAGARLIPVQLEWAGHAPEGPVVIAAVTTHRIGVLSREYGLPVADVLQEARHQNRPVMMLGIYGRTGDDPPRLRVYPYGPPRR